MDRTKATTEKPLLNQATYQSEVEWNSAETSDTLYPTLQKLQDVEGPYAIKVHFDRFRQPGGATPFQKVTAAAINWLNSTERIMKENAQQGDITKEMFEKNVRDYFRHAYPQYFVTDNCSEQETANRTADLETMVRWISMAVYGYYVIQPLIDDEKVSDIIISKPNDIVARIHGNAYVSDLSFSSDDDLTAFVQGIAIRSNIEYSENNAQPTFVDDRHPKYRLRICMLRRYLRFESDKRTTEFWHQPPHLLDNRFRLSVCGAKDRCHLLLSEKSDSILPNQEVCDFE